LEDTSECQQPKTPQVNEVNEFLEIASDFEDPLEVIRESLSNKVMTPVRPKSKLPFETDQLI